MKVISWSFTNLLLFLYSVDNNFQMSKHNINFDVTGFYVECTSMLFNWENNIIRRKIDILGNMAIETLCMT